MAKHFREILPDRLVERARLLPISDRGTIEGKFVLYWMRTAARAHENPALNAAIHLGNELDLPPFIFHGISVNHDYASARHQTFELEGAAEVQHELKNRSIGYVCHLPSTDDETEKSILVELASKAAYVVVEDMPVDPSRTWHRALAAQISTPVLAVDTDCIVPMRQVGRLYDRAYKYRNATKQMRQGRIRKEFSPVEPNTGCFRPEMSRLQSIDFDEVSIPDLIAQTDVDHQVAPIPGMVGGKGAGYRRWDNFKSEGLDIYHRTRNDPTRPKSVSRLSPYLHWGHISPFRVARQAESHDSKGAQKFIDELVTWREMSHHFCFYEPNYDSADALPDWALQTLRKHEDDPRPSIYDWEKLARAKTGDRVWDAAQTSLIRHGELHNNIRMTWAKKLLEWTPDIETALAFAIDLNHRYALDGRDPNSYHGILWCFGGFDRPFKPEKPIIGKVRPRDTEWYAEYIDLDSYEEYVYQPTLNAARRVAVVGAGLSGAAAARVLNDHGVDVDLYERGRGPGGRASTRVVEDSHRRHFEFDHGAQYFTSYDERLRRYIEAWCQKGIIDQWSPKIVAIEVDGEYRQLANQPERYVGTPKMSCLCNHLCSDIAVQKNTEIESLTQQNGGWSLTDTSKNTYTDYDGIILAMPPMQANEILEGQTEALYFPQFDRLKMEPVWATMVALTEPLEVAFDAAFVNHGDLSWIANNSSKPGRNQPNCWVLHSDTGWASERLDWKSERVSERLIEKFFSLLDISDRPQIQYQSAHRWSYAKADAALDHRYLEKPEKNILIAGDWLNGSRVEGALLSGMSASSRMMQLMEPDTDFRQRKVPGIE